MLSCLTLQEHALPNLQAIRKLLRQPSAPLHSNALPAQFERLRQPCHAEAPRGESRSSKSEGGAPFEYSIRVLSLRSAIRTSASLSRPCSNCPPAVRTQMTYSNTINCCNKVKVVVYTFMFLRPPQSSPFSVYLDRSNSAFNRPRRFLVAQALLPVRLSPRSTSRRAGKRSMPPTTPHSTTHRGIAALRVVTPGATPAE